MLFLSLSLAFASDPVDIGVLQEKDIKVVQKLLFSKEDRLELSAHLGVMPFDGFTWAPSAALGGAYHVSESLGFEGRLGGGYGFKTSRYTLLESSAYGVAVEAYRYLGSAEATVLWSPIYAKMNVAGRRIIHHDVYLLAGAGVTLEQSVLPSVDIAIAPTLPLGIGARVFFADNLAFRVELRDGLMIEKREQSDVTAFKQSVGVNLGLSYFGKKG